MWRFRQTSGTRCGHFARCTWRFCRLLPLDAICLHADIPGVLVGAHSKKDWLAQFSIGGPLAELHFDDDFGLHPVSSFVRARSFLERRFLLRQRLKAFIHRAQSGAGESAAGVADVDELASIEVSEKQGADVLATVSWLRETADHEFLPELD